MGKKLTTEQFIERARKIHGDKYDYSKVEYNGNHTKVCIICSLHGEFWQTPAIHLKGCECPKCIIEKNSFKQRLGIESFIKRAREIHGDKYDYSKVDYINNRTKVHIICPKHGEFWQTPVKHLIGRGCRKCANERISEFRHDTFDDFVNKAVKVHGNKFEYHKETYVNSLNKILITCKIHGNFWQVPSSHLRGVGCPFCKESKLERNVAFKLQENEIEFVRSYKADWLDKQHLDFYLPQYNIAIECQGEQHFKAKKCWDKAERNSLEHRIDLDKQKLKLCEEHNIKLLYFSDKQYKDNIITNENKLLEEIKKYDI